MRTAFNGEIYEENGQFYGINLGADFCAEHEWGIKRLQQLLKVETEAIGLDRYKTHNPNVDDYMITGTFTRQGKKYVGLIVTASPWELRNCKEDLKAKGYVQPWSDKFRFWAAWDECSFGITVSDEDKSIITAIIEGLKTNTMTIGVGKGHVFKNGGLVLMLESAFDEKNKEDIKEEHLEHARLLQAAEDTGIAQLLKEAGKRYYALVPEWKTKFEEKETAYDVVYFLNPMEQQKNNFGWFTVEELQLWAKDQGPIPKK